jgi:uncharacterized membrane protein
VNEQVRTAVRWVLAAFMVAIGTAHLVVPGPFVEIMPAPLAAHGLFLVMLSGVFEILGGIGILVPATRRFAGYGLVALYVAVFPANINMAMHDLAPGGLALPHWMLLARLPFQLVFIGVALWVSRPPDSPPSPGPSAASPG